MNQAEKRWLGILERELKKEMDKAPSFVSSHDINHIRRVWKYAKQIARDMDVDWEVLIAATFLHDIGRHYPEGVREHGSVSAPIAEGVLKRIGFPEEKTGNALISIRYHDETHPYEKRSTTESKVLYDADKLDVFGAIGVSRYLIFNALRNKTLKETVEYVLGNLPLRFEQLELEETRKIGESRFRYALDYFRKLKEEMGY